jgi:Ca2+-binding RTX toxin-like protein
MSAFKTALRQLLRPRPTAPIRRPQLDLQPLDGRVNPVTAVYDPATHFLTITGTPNTDYVEVRRSGDDIRVNGALVAGGPTVQNTDRVFIATGDSNDVLTLDMSGGAFAPGFTPEGDPAEIEFVVDSGNTPQDTLTILGTPGDDVIELGLTGDVRTVNLNGDADADLIAFGEYLEFRVDGGLGNDVIDGSGNRVVGGTFQGFTLYGGAGNDTLAGEGGNDNLFGEGGNDSLDGGTGDDYQVGGIGDDSLLGRSGDDTLRGSAGNDVMDGGAGVDFLYGGDGNDKLLGGAGDDWLFGEAGNDIADGGAGNDKITGGDGDDDLNGGIGVDLVVGWNGNDTLDGGNDNVIDVLIGGNGRDSFHFDWFERFFSDFDPSEDEII